MLIIILKFRFFVRPNNKLSLRKFLLMLRTFYYHLIPPVRTYLFDRNLLIKGSKNSTECFQ